MNKFTETVKRKFLETTEKYSMFSDVENIVVGFSGGADSLCLLHLLNEHKNRFSYKVTAVHINHGIRGEEAVRDAEFAEEFCRENDIDFVLHIIDCVSEANETGESLEECGRRKRYELFNSHCSESSRIATAHNANDNAETVIFNLTRGSSLKGICGIPPLRDNIIRPIINCSREEIEGYCKENNLLFVTDSTNLCDDYTRNKIRHSVLPVLTEINPAFIESVSSFTKNVSDAYSYISTEAENALNKAEISECVYNADFLLSLDKAVTSEAIVKAYSKISGKKLDNKKVNDIYKLLSNGGRLQLYGKNFAEVKKGKLRFFKNEVIKNDNEIIINEIPFNCVFGDFEIEISEYINYSKKIHHLVLDNLIDCDKINGKIFLRSRRAGDKFSFYNRNVSKTLKKLFNEAEIPLEKRDSIPILCDEKGVVWVHGFGTNSEYRVSEKTNNIIIVRGKNK